MPRRGKQRDCSPKNETVGTGGKTPTYVTQKEIKSKNKAKGVNI